MATVAYFNSSLSMTCILTPLLILLILGILACMFVLFFSLLPVDIFNFIDGKCSLYLYQAKVSFIDKIKHIMSLHTIQNVVSLLYLPLYLYLIYDIAY